MENKKHKWSLFLVSLPVMIWTLIPVLWILSLAIRPQSELGSRKFIPETFSLENFKLVLTGNASDLFLPSLRNSIIVGLSATVISVVLATFCAYAIARLDFPGKKAILFTSLTVSFFPVISGARSACSTQSRV